MDDFIRFIGFMVGLCVSLFCAFVFCSFMWSTTIVRWSCEDFQEMTGMQSQFSIYKGCYITLDNGEVVSLIIAEKVRSQKYNINYQDKY